MDEVEKLRTKMHKLLKKCNYDTADKRLVKISQQLDKALNACNTS